MDLKLEAFGIKHHGVGILDLKHRGIAGDQRRATVIQSTPRGTIDLFDVGASRSLVGW